MSFAPWLRKAFGTRIHGTPVSRRSKPRKPQQRWVGRLELLEDRVTPATLMVTNLADSGAGSLRAAIESSVFRTGGGTGNDIIRFSPQIDGGTIGLTRYINDVNVLGPTAFCIKPATTLTIDGETGLTKGITIAATGPTPFRIFYVYPPVSLTLIGLTLRGGIAQGGNGGSSDGGGGGGGGAAGMGGAIFNQGTLTLKDSTLTGDIAQGGNGGNSPIAFSGGGGGGGGTGGNGGKGNKGAVTAGDLHLYGGGGGGPNGGPSDSRTTVFTGGSGNSGGIGGGGSGGLADSFAGLPSAKFGSSGGFGGGGGGAGMVFNPPSSSYFVPSYNGQGTWGSTGGDGGFGGGGGGASGNWRTYLGSYGGFGAGGGAGNKGNTGGGGGGGAGMGGAIFNEAGTITITNSTFAGDGAYGGAGGKGAINNGGDGLGLGGAIFNHNGTISIGNSTLSANAANQGRGLYVLADSKGKTTSRITATANILNTIIGQSDTAVSDMVITTTGTGASATANGGLNVIRTLVVGAGATDNLTGKITGDPRLGPLQNNGGTSPTMALGLGSSAFDAGSTSLAPVTDQRGMGRVGQADIGAFENQLAGQVVVSTTADTVTSSDNKLSLREALGLVQGTLSFNSLSAAEKSQIQRTAGVGLTITFDASLNGSTITLSTVGDNSVGKSAFLINSPVVINGPVGNSGITLAVAQATPMRLFDVTSTGNLTLQNLTLQGGTAQGFQGGAGQAGGAGGGSAGLGGAIFNQGTLTILNSTLTGNTAQGGTGGFGGAGAGGGGGGGAGLSAAGTASASNYGSPGGGPNGGAGGVGNAFFALPGADGGFGGGGGGGAGINQNSRSNGGASLFGGGGGGAGMSAVGGSGGLGGGGGGGYGSGGYGGGRGASGNFAPGGGGAGMGGAVFNEAGTITITNSTFTGNTAIGGAAGPGTPGLSNPAAAGKGLGGGLFNHNGTIVVENSTFSSNTANGGRGIFNLGDSLSETTPSITATASISNSILGQTDNSVEDFTGKTSGSGVNTTLGSGDLIRSQSGFKGAVVSTADPLLGQLQANGGPTSTMAPSATSPAIAAGTRTSTPTATAVYAGPVGRLTPGAYSYRVSAFNAAGETLASVPVVVGVPQFFGAVQISWNVVSGPVSGYKVYGRTFGSEQLIAMVGPGVTSFVDNGATTPSGALPTTNTTTLTTDQRGSVRPPLPDIGAFQLLTVSTQYNVTTDAQAQAAFQAINAMSPQSAKVLVQVNLAAGTYSDIVLHPPAGVIVVVKGNGPDTVIVGHSPALTVTDGGEVEVDNLTLTTQTDSPTVLVTGGKLTLWSDVIEETPGFNDPAIKVTGGLVDLGTTDAPGDNEFDGQGNFLSSADPSEIIINGDLFDANGVMETGSEPTTTTVTAPTGSIVQGQSVQFTATVTASNGALPTGDVDFFDATSNFDFGRVTLSLVNGSAQAVFTTSDLSVGTHQIRAIYVGDGTFIPSEDVAETTIASADTPAVAKQKAYVNAIYQQILNRDADPAGATFWVGQLTQGVSRQQVSADILESDEGRLAQIDDLYETYLGRAGDQAGEQFHLQYLENGGTLEGLRTIFLTSDEFMALGGGTPKGYVSALYHVVLGRISQGDAGANSFATSIQQGGDIAGVVHAILDSQEANEKLVSHLYGTILQRDADPDGLSFWTSQLQQGGGAEELAIESLLASDEFFNLS